VKCDQQWLIGIYQALVFHAPSSPSKKKDVGISLTEPLLAEGWGIIRWILLESLSAPFASQRQRHARKGGSEAKPNWPL